MSKFSSARHALALAFVQHLMLLLVVVENLFFPTGWKIGLQTYGTTPLTLHMPTALYSAIK
jgi:hypothetical protein